MLALRFFVCLVASAVGLAAAWKLSRPPKKRPLLILLLAFAVAFIVFGSKILPPQWALRWDEFAWGGIGGQTLLALLIPVVGAQAADAISSRVLRYVVLALMAGAFFQQVWFGVLDSIVTRPELSRLQTKFTSTGVCLQSTGYTCGPAAAVSVLKHFGYDATEGGVGLAAETGRYYGTDEFRLTRALNKIAPGLDCHVAQFNNVDDLQNQPPVLLIVGLDADIAHYIVVYKFDGKWADYADPLGGGGRIRREGLEHGWTGRAIICEKRQAAQ